MTEADPYDDQTFQVVVNHEEQYSIWEEGRELPLGWKPIGYTGTKEACLDHVEQFPERPPQAVQPHDGQRVAWPQVVQQGGEPRAVEGLP